MSILVNKDTKLLVQGITGREGMFHTEQMIAYGTNVVGGVTPDKGGQMVLGNVPVFNTVREAVEKSCANATILFVPAKFTVPAAYEAIDAGMKLIITIAEHVPVQEMMRIHYYAKLLNVRVIGPNSFGIISPGECKAGFMPHSIFMKGFVGILSRSASNCYETVLNMKSKNIGQSTCVGIGGDMIPGSTFADLISDFQNDPMTKAIVIIGEIGGCDEELAAEYIKNNITKPCVALIVGKNAPKGRNMGHAGAIVGADGTGSAKIKEKILKEAGCYIAESTLHIVEILDSLL